MSSSKEVAKKIRRRILTASFEANACHIGSALSCVEILLEIYSRMEDGDSFIFSKASGVAALYAVLAERGVIPEDKVAYYLKKYPLPHKAVPNVLHSFGSVGHGLSVAVGMALGDRGKNIYVLIGDGECQEGSVYEAALFARQHRLTNLYVFIDNNRLQALGRTEDILELTTAFEFLEKTLPNVSIVDTVKGDGVSFLENKVESHYINLTKEQLNQALSELE